MKERGMKTGYERGITTVSAWLKEQVQLHQDVGLTETARVLDEIAAAIDAGEVQEWDAKQVM
jgi:hypothetical protein